MNQFVIPLSCNCPMPVTQQQQRMPPIHAFIHEPTRVHLLLVATVNTLPDGPRVEPFGSSLLGSLSTWHRPAKKPEPVVSSRRPWSWRTIKRSHFQPASILGPTSVDYHKSLRSVLLSLRASTSIQTTVDYSQTPTLCGTARPEWNCCIQ